MTYGTTPLQAYIDCSVGQDRAAVHPLNDVCARKCMRRCVCSGSVRHAKRHCCCRASIAPHLYFPVLHRCLLPSYGNSITLPAKTKQKEEVLPLYLLHPATNVQSTCTLNSPTKNRALLRDCSSAICPCSAAAAAAVLATLRDRCRQHVNTQAESFFLSTHVLQT